MSFNKVILVGRLTKDPEIRTTVNGTTVGNFTLAVDSGYGDNKSTDFINVVSFGKQAEFVNKFLRKGVLILIEGQLKINKWTDRNDVKRETPEIILNSTTFLQSKKKEAPEDFIPEATGFNDPFDEAFKGDEII